jgi:hypothetical protein
MYGVEGTLSATAILVVADRAHRAIALACGALVVATVAVGIALGFEGQAKHFRQNNPALLDKLELSFSFCRVEERPFWLT